MKTIKQYTHQLVTAATPLPQVVQKPGLLKLWLFRLSRQRIYLLAGLLVLIFSVNPISQGLVEFWYPMEPRTLKTTISGILNPSARRASINTRDTRYQQLLILFWSLGLSAAAIVLILDLPAAVKKGEQQAQKLLRQSRSVQSTDPELASSLASTAYQLMLNSEIPDGVEVGHGDLVSSKDPTDLAKTVATSKAAKSVRYVGENKRYRIDKALASGGAGVVYLAFDTLLEREVALKELFRELAHNKEHAERFKVEARALAALNHPHILPVFDFLQAGGHFWLVMEFLSGGNLKDKIDLPGTLSITDSIRITKGIASGLGYAHEKGFIHRDIKPENILFAGDQSFRITDFGIAKHDTSSVKTQHGVILGSPGYMSPEQSAGEDIDVRTDIYSLGITLYQMLTGMLPFEGDTASVLAQQITQAPTKLSELNPEINRELESIVLKMLKKKPMQRYSSTQKLIKALDELTTV